MTSEKSCALQENLQKFRLMLRLFLLAAVFTVAAGISTRCKKTFSALGKDHASPLKYLKAVVSASSGRECIELAKQVSVTKLLWRGVVVEGELFCFYSPSFSPSPVPPFPHLTDLFLTCSFLPPVPYLFLTSRTALLWLRRARQSTG